MTPMSSDPHADCYKRADEVYHTTLARVAHEAKHPRTDCIPDPFGEAIRAAAEVIKAHVESYNSGGPENPLNTPAETAETILRLRTERDHYRTTLERTRALFDAGMSVRAQELIAEALLPIDRPYQS